MNRTQSSVSTPATTAALVLGAIALGSSALAIWITLGHQLFPSIGPLRISVRNPRNPAVIAILTAALALWMDRGVIWEAIAKLVRRMAAPAALAIGLAVLLVAARYGAPAVGGSDSSGYANAARVLRTFNVQRPLTLTGSVDWPDKEGTLTPLGFKTVPAGGAIVPTYPPGYPAMMAAAAALAGEDAIYVVVPLCSALTVWIAFLIGRTLAGPVGGLVTAILLAVSPTVLFQTFLPFSDIPATLWWTLAFYLLTKQRGPGVTCLAGVASGFSVLVRPNLLVLALAAVPLIAWWKPDQVSTQRRVLSYVAGLVPGLVSFLAWNKAVYGSFVQTGYGATGYMFSLDHVVPNVARYADWLISLHTPIVLLGVLAPFVLWLTARDHHHVSRHRRRTATCALVFIICLQAFYLVYLVFDNWTFYRFMLPTLPLLMALVSTVLVHAFARVSIPLRVFSGWVVVVGLALYGLSSAQRLDVFKVGNGERRFEQAAHAVITQTSPDAVVFSMLHSGSLSYYTDRVIARWDGVPTGSLVRFAKDLHALDKRAYLVIDDLELQDFQRQHAAEFERLPQLAQAVVVDEPIRVRLYDLSRAVEH